jgi:hypothetical protein
MGSLISRRSFVGGGLAAAAASTVLQGHQFLGSRGWLEASQLASADLRHETINALFAFVVPGPDAYSVAQGVSTPEPGGVESGAVEGFIATLDASTPYVPSFSATVAAALNGLALAVNPTGGGSFVSPFANLSFAGKAAVFQIMDATDQLKVLGSLLPLFVAYFTYSEAGAFDPVTRSLTGHPMGWRLSNYRGIADGRDEFLGYFAGRGRI